MRRRKKKRGSPSRKNRGVREMPQAFHKISGRAGVPPPPPQLIFPPAPAANDGFTNASLAQFSSDPASCVRELIQNSLDAALVGSEREVAKICFSVEKVSANQIPDMNAYCRAFESAKKRGTNSQSNNIVKEIENSLQESDVAVLYVADNGVGFGKDQLNAMLGDGESYKGNQAEGASGSFGNGHLTAFALSHLRYIFYGGVLKGGDMLSAGHAILASHIGERGKACSKDGFFVCGINDSDLFDRFVFARDGHVPDILRSRMDRIQHWGHGALVAIVGFNHFGEDDDGDEQGDQSTAEIILQEAALNFFVAIDEGRLEVDVEENGETHTISESALRTVLEGRKDQKKSKRKGFPSGNRVWNAYDTYTNGENHVIKTSFGEVHVRLREGGEGRKVAVCRNGMWIDDDVPMLRPSYFGDRINFEALLLVDSRHEGDVHNMLRLTEPPLHNEINTQNIRSKEEKAAVRKLLKEIREKIRELVSERTEETFALDDILSFEETGTVKGGAAPRASQSTQTVKPISGGKSGKGKGTDKPKSTPNSRPGKALGAKVSSRRTAVGVLSIVLQAQENCDDVEMWLSLDEGKDITCAGSEFRASFQPIRKASVNGKVVHNGPDVKSVRLGAWAEGETYEVEVCYEPPQQKEYYALNFDFAKRKAPQKEENNA